MFEEEKGKKYKTHPVSPDPKFDSVLVSKFINHLMKGGKKSVARKIVYNSFERIKKETKKDPLEVFKEALDKITPEMEVRSKRVGGATYQVPYKVDQKRGTSLAMRWMVEATRSKKGASTEEKLTKEILEALKGQGDAIKKKDNVERMAQANKAFAFLAK